MKSLVQLKTNPLVIIALAFICFAVLPGMQAVVPPPDGGYPNFTTAEGQNALQSLTTGAANTAVGWRSLFSNAAGSFNTATGAGSLVLNSGDENTATGVAALLLNTTGAGNTANGAVALLNNHTGGSNTAIGVEALFNNDTGGSNTAIGAFALANNTTGGGNIALGVGTGSGVTTASDVICIGDNGADVDNSCFIGNIRGVTTQIADAIPVLIASNGQLGTMSCSRRFKKEIKAMEQASESILALKPVTFHYKSDNTGTPQFGLIAEEVAEANPDLVVRDENGQIYTVRYDAVNAMLLNEFLKARRQIDAQQKQIDALTAGLQKVSAQIEASKPAPQMVATN